MNDVDFQPWCCWSSWSYNVFIWWRWSWQICHALQESKGTFINYSEWGGGDIKGGLTNFYNIKRGAHKNFELLILYWYNSWFVMIMTIYSNLFYIWTYYIIIIHNYDHYIFFYYVGISTSWWRTGSISKWRGRFKLFPTHIKTALFNLHYICDNLCKLYIDQ